MGPRKLKSDKGNDSNKKMGRSSGNPMEDSHPRLLKEYADLGKIRIKFILRSDKNYVKQWIQAIA